MLAPIDPVRRKTQDLRLIAQLTNRNIKDFAAVHGLHVQMTLYPSAPIAHDCRIVVQRADRTNGIHVCRGDLVHVRKSSTTNLEFDDLVHGQDSQSIKNLRQVDASGSANRSAS